MMRLPMLNLALLLLLLPPALLHAQTVHLPRFLAEVDPATLVDGADGFGAMRDDLPAAPLLRGGEAIGWVFITSDFVGTTGYAGKPIHVMVAVDDDATVIGVQLVQHWEPIVLIGISEARVRALTADYAGLDLVAEAEAGGMAHDLHIISGATVTIMVIDDSIVRSGIRVARALGLGGLAPLAPPTGPRFAIDPAAEAADDWFTLVGDGTVRRMSLDVGQVNEAFAAMADPRAAARPHRGEPDDTFIDMYAALVSVPAIGEALLGPAEYANLERWLDEGEHAILVAGRGDYSFKGSGYVRGGVFDRIILIQGDDSVRFRDRGHRGSVTSRPRARPASASWICSRSRPMPASIRPSPGACSCWSNATSAPSSGSSPPSISPTAHRSSTCANWSRPRPLRSTRRTRQRSRRPSRRSGSASGGTRPGRSPACC